MFSKFKNSYWFYFYPCLVIFLILKLGGQWWIQFLYTHKHFDILDAICKNQGPMPLDFYLGKVENVLLGPIKMVLLGTLLLSFLLVFKEKLTLRRLTSIIFIYLLVVRGEVLLDPPYGEAVTGPYVDAVWLYNHSLNYIAFLQQETMASGGPQIYPTSLYPLFSATLMKIFANPPLFILVMHLLNFIFAAIIVSLLYKILTKVFDDTMGIYGAILLLSWPVFQSLVGLINMEMFCVFFAMLAAYYLCQRRFLAAAVAAILSDFMKDPGVIACFAVGIFSIFEFIDKRKEKGSWKILLCGLGILAASIVKFKIRALMVGPQVNSNRVSMFIGLPHILSNPWSRLYFISLLIFIERSFAWWIQNWKNKNKLSQFFNQHYEMLIMLAIGSFWFIVYLNFSACLHRYLLLLLPFLAFAFIYILNSLFKSPPWVKLAVVILICYLFLPYHVLKLIPLTICALIAVFILASSRLWNYSMIGLIIFIFSCTYGSLYPNYCDYNLMYDNKCSRADLAAEACYEPRPIDQHISSCNPTMLERSLEYRNYLKLNQKLARELETNFSDYLIVAPTGISEVFAFPELGYVRKKLNVQEYGGTVNLGIEAFQGFSKIDLRKTIYVGYRYHFLTTKEPFPIHPQDKIIENLMYGDIQGTLFMKGLAIERIRLIIEYLTTHHL